MNEIFFMQAKNANQTPLYLYQLNKGNFCQIIGYGNKIDYKLKKRLLELGFNLGTILKLNEKSFLKNVVLVEINGYILSLRKSVAKEILIKKI